MEQEQIGKLLRIGGAAATVGVVSCVHAAAELMPLGQIMAFRAMISGLLILLYGLCFNNPADLLPKSWKPHLIRGLLACCAMVLSYIAFARLPVTQAQTLSFLAPLIVLPIAIVRLGEPLTARLAVGLLTGFAGVLLILGLSFETGPFAFWGAVAGIAGAVFVAIIQVKIRAMTMTETAISISLSFTVIVACVTGPSVFLGNWVWPDSVGILLLIAAGIFGALNLVLFAESLARAPASAVAPLDYTGLIWALLADFWIFSQVPGPTGVLGSVLITVAALIVVLKPRGKHGR
ncbi:DMT family transporter [uncultured Tateyamaria sp.]|uniref:DMT family transporter n=1 Tax=Tateyamaria sp. 1078 TaxID=3417464 RepID=UPI0026328387|nr:DMT family transporter [uncultured Tateyamaria sp.]